MKMNGQYVQNVKHIVRQGRIIAGMSDVAIQTKSKVKAIVNDFDYIYQMTQTFECSMQQSYIYSVLV